MEVVDLTGPEACAPSSGAGSGSLRGRKREREEEGVSESGGALDGCKFDDVTDGDDEEVEYVGTIAATRKNWSSKKEQKRRKKEKKRKRKERKRRKRRKKELKRFESDHAENEHKKKQEKASTCSSFSSSLSMGSTVEASSRQTARNHETRWQEWTPPSQEGESSQNSVLRPNLPSMPMNLQRGRAAYSQWIKQVNMYNRAREEEKLKRDALEQEKLFQAAHRKMASQMEREKKRRQRLEEIERLQSLNERRALLINNGWQSLVLDLPEDSKEWPNFASHDPYECLGLPRKSTTGEIRRRFRKLALMFHPDKNHRKEAHAIFAEFSSAYKKLT